MDAPPDKEDCHPFVAVQALMHGAGLRVPEILAWDEARGFLLLSDLGAQTAIERLDPADPQAAHGWYLQAVDLLVDWRKASRAGALPPYDEALLRRELQLFPDWYVARHRGVALDAKQQAVLAQAFDAIVAHNLAVPRVFVHRDFMMRNLIVGGDGRLGVLDFQDAVCGPITYDIASLMRDAFISWRRTSSSTSPCATGKRRGRARCWARAARAAGARTSASSTAPWSGWRCSAT